MRLFLVILLASVCLINLTQCFIPADLISIVFSKLEGPFSSRLEKAGVTLTHDDIIKYGILQSVIEYYANKTNGVRPINKNRTEYYYDLKNLYYDYYGIYLCDIELDKLIAKVFQPNVAIVDMDKLTKDLPYAHFDAETFSESNTRVMNAMTRINDAIILKDYEKARIESGRILHTIQDFYSHSNYVEMGNTEINIKIGTNNFTQILIINKNETNVCVNNCTRIEEKCGFMWNVISNLVSLLGMNLNLMSCPLVYYKCSGNVVILNKLVSGYYANQKLPDGTDYTKPNNYAKCSHGGMFDATSLEPSEGGMNKDSAYYILSPHADLHAAAAQLAIKHTKYFFNNFRAKYGDTVYENLLSLRPPNSSFTDENRKLRFCDAANLKSSKMLFLIMLPIFYSFFN